MPFSWISFEEITKGGEETKGMRGGVEETVKGEIIKNILLKCYLK